MIPQYFGIPPEFYDSPNCIKMSHATARFYGFIFWMSDRRCSRQVDVTDEVIIQRTNLSPRTLALARKDLCQRGLIVCVRQQRGHRYVICDPNTGQPFPGDPKEKLLNQRKRGKPVEKFAEESLDKPPVPQPAPQLVRKPVVQTLPVRPDGNRDYGYDEAFRSS